MLPQNSDSTIITIGDIIIITIGVSRPFKPILSLLTEIENSVAIAAIIEFLNRIMDKVQIIVIKKKHWINNILKVIKQIWCKRTLTMFIIKGKQIHNNLNNTFLL
ncbi:hypothetical protein QL285_053604 [Trifolium repens]|nr:hypothetical protein QL285_053604 [Trifolium repens]